MKIIMSFKRFDIDKYIDEQLNNDLEFREAWENSQSEYVVLAQLVKLRKEKGLTQKDLAKLSGNKQQVISRIEKHESSPTLKTLSSIANALGAEIMLVPKSMPIEAK